jgi:hypothetical protein
MKDILRQLIEDNDDGDATAGRLDDMTLGNASIDLAQSIMLLDPTPAEFEALRSDLADVLAGSAIEVNHTISGHVVTADLGESGHDNEMTIFVDGVRILRVDTNFIDRRIAA